MQKWAHCVAQWAAQARIKVAPAARAEAACRLARVAGGIRLRGGEAELPIILAAAAPRIDAEAALDRVRHLMAARAAGKADPSVAEDGGAVGQGEVAVRAQAPVMM